MGHYHLILTFEQQITMTIDILVNIHCCMHVHVVIASNVELNAYTCHVAAQTCEWELLIIFMWCCHRGCPRKGWCESGNPCDPLSQSINLKL